MHFVLIDRHNEDAVWFNSRLANRKRRSIIESHLLCRHSSLASTMRLLYF
jgi:hypothetical protein